MTLNANANRDKQRDTFIYDTLHLKPIPSLSSTSSSISISSNPNTITRHLGDSIQTEIKTHFFSTYPYYVSHESSKRAIKSRHSGNCIALSYGLQARLKQHGYMAYLIPASVPRKYRMEDYSEFPISHVAVCVIIDDSKRYILDPAFYFVSPLEVKQGARTKSVDIYNDKSYKRHSAILQEVVCRDVRKESIQHESKKIEYDLVKVSYNDHTAGDTWDYHLVNILNPDSSIGLKYLHMKKEAFLCIVDRNMVMTCMVKQKVPGGITLMENGEYNTYEGVRAIPPEKKRRFEEIYGMKKYLTWDECERFEKMYDDNSKFDKLRLDFRGNQNNKKNRKRSVRNKTKKKHF